VFAFAWLSSPARADVQRFAVLVGNDRGNGSDAALHYAETDATKVEAVLRDLGGFAPANVTVLHGESAETVRKTLVAVNDRIRATSSLPDTQTMLFVYYSGHADANALHLAGSRLELNELAQLVRGSAATFRLLVLDACRSGTLTRVKGGTQVPPFAIPPDPSLRGEGLAFLTASSALEDAQESDEIRGSFFTHALVSGLMGAADRDGDGNVVLDEAYRYAYEATLRATSRTYAGLQHPTFHYDFRGQDALVLTRLRNAPGRATLAFPANTGFLLLRDDPNGPVVAEVGPRDVARRLSLRPGRYFVRGRGVDVLFEGDVTLREAEDRTLALGELRRVEYARLVRKGGSDSTLAHGVEAGFTVRTRLPNAGRPCVGFAAGYRLELHDLGFVARLGACRSGSENAVVRATTDELDVSVAALRAWDLPWVTLALGLGAGAGVFFQRFETAGRAPSRDTVAPFGLAVGSATLDVGGPWFVSADVRAETYFLRLQEDTRSAASTDVAFTVQGTATAGLHF
jgi:hypothetical protein